LTTTIPPAGIGHLLAQQPILAESGVAGDCLWDGGNETLVGERAGLFEPGDGVRQVAFGSHAVGIHGARTDRFPPTRSRARGARPRRRAPHQRLMLGGGTDRTRNPARIHEAPTGSRVAPLRCPILRPDTSSDQDRRTGNKGSLGAHSALPMCPGVHGAVHSDGCFGLVEVVEVMEPDTLLSERSDEAIDAPVALGLSVESSQVV
jgi:hypothetical protein